jgi:hypothetical protein
MFSTWRIVDPMVNVPAAKVAACAIGGRGSSGFVAIFIGGTCLPWVIYPRLLGWSRF